MAALMLVSCHNVLHEMRFYPVWNFKKHFFSAVKQRCMLQFCTSLVVFLGTQEPCIFPYVLSMGNPGKRWESCALASLLLITQLFPEATKRKLNSWISLHLHTDTFFMYSLCHFNEITKANNLAAFSHHVLLWPCVRKGSPVFKWCLIVLCCRGLK